jgi:REP element-mobilizing transposase RayT
MTAPRRLIAGTTYLVTRRCLDRQFLLRPSKLTNQNFGFLLAVAARRFDIDLHACCVMSNHVHIVLTDRKANLPDFHRFLDSLVARSMNAMLGRRDYFWASASYSAVALQGPSDIVDKAAYVLANPVAAGLVRRGRQWPGLWLAPEKHAGHAVEFERPAQFFRTRGSKALPERSSLSLVAPPGFESLEEFTRAVASALEALETQAEVERRHEGRSVLGPAAVLAQRPFARPGSQEPLGGLNPRVASKEKKRRIQALTDLVEFLTTYRLAIARWRAGARDALFPHGTYLMRVLHGASCATPG